MCINVKLNVLDSVGISDDCPQSKLFGHSGSFETHKIVNIGIRDFTT